MASFLGQPYMGPSKVPHADPEFFKVYFAGAHLAVAMLTLNGRFLGTEPRPRRFNREYVLSCCDEAAKRREALRGQVPRTWIKGKPRATDHSWEKMFDAHLHWKRWTQERMGPWYSPS
ncbi:ATP-dependent DNA ligase isoform A [Chlorella sorokiniana]|uniref:ATP-dependent DNA ligase isoform A n=1 Tax=Chlorella sorokiniana TaxID=3076 RepID=A0A2P6TBM6_CHLSO|nr:ATP-dependent DNA ligase isoform A [Chlorella sorokiniana]|eukprot:PRW05952.1 ATP-dependent DNA ligase isoform A [Chlorella sorokiniana]